MHNPIPRSWRTPLILTCLSLVPILATASRLISFSGSEVETDPNLERFDGTFEMLIVHILAGSLFLLLSAVQFSSELRLAHPAWHRNSGKVAMVAGIVAGVSGVWLILFYPPSELATPTMDALRILFGSALISSILLAFLKIRQRNVSGHRAWMIRAFALGVAGSTQALVIGTWIVAIGPLTPNSATALITIGFLINIVIAEWRIRVRSNATPILKPQRTTL